MTARKHLSLTYYYYEDGCRYKSSLGQGIIRAASTHHQTPPPASILVGPAIAAQGCVQLLSFSWYRSFFPLTAIWFFLPYIKYFLFLLQLLRSVLPTFGFFSFLCFYGCILSSSNFLFHKFFTEKRRFFGLIITRIGARFIRPFYVSETKCYFIFHKILLIRISNGPGPRNNLN